METEIKEVSKKYEKYSLYIKTLHSNILRILFDSLKDILQDVNIIFSETGMKIVATDSSKVAFVHLKLQADKFREGGKYHCPTKITVGVSLVNLNKLIKSIGPGDIITLYIEKGKEDKLGIKIENSDKNSKTSSALNLFDIEQENSKLPNYQFPSFITMQSQDFQKQCRDLNLINDEVELESFGDSLKFRCSGDFASKEITVGDTSSEESGEGRGVVDTPIKATFSLKYLNLFTKATNLSSTIKIMFTNDAPLIIEYSVASLGELKFCLAPKIVN